jgi:diacylglycerol kinase (ATP)
MSRRILFVINPRAGRKLMIDLPGHISRVFDAPFVTEIFYWREPANIGEFSDKIRSGVFTDAVAVGGDGTVNLIASLVHGTQVRLGIVPAGSGNGMARSLGIPLDPLKALYTVRDGICDGIDCGIVNGQKFFCTSGCGFDAHVGLLFATATKRGLRNYIRIVIRELVSYRTTNYRLLLGADVVERRAFLVTVANAPQYGNDFFIAPGASMKDGKFHVVVVSRLRPYDILPLLTRILLRRIGTSRRVETFVSDKIVIERERPAPIHIDGEPVNAASRLVYEISPLSVQVICGKTPL